MEGVMKRALLILTVSLLTSVLSLAGDIPLYNGGKVYFVYAKKGKDSNDGLSSKRALKTIQKALDKAQPGDTIVILPGSYYQSFKTVRSGTKDKPITIVGMPGSTIYGQKTPRGRVIEVRHSYINLVNLRVDGHFNRSCNDEDCYKDELVYVVGSPDNPLEGVNLIGSTLRYALGECVRYKFTSNSEIAYNRIYHCGLEDFRFGGDGQNGEGIYIGTSPKQLPEGVVDRSLNNFVHHNTIATYGAECIESKEGADGTVVKDNFCMKTKQKTSGGISMRSNDNLLERNVSFDNYGAGIRLGGHQEEGVNNTVVYNFIDNSRFSALKIMKDEQRKICGNRATDSVNRLLYPEDSPYAESAFSDCEE
jgi:hypothetical protein